MWWRRVQPWINRAVDPAWKAHFASPLIDGGVRRIACRASWNRLLVQMRCELLTVVPAREDVVSLALQAETLAGSTTFLFHSRVGFWSTRADHLANVASGHLVMSRSRIILQDVPQGA